MKKQTKNEGKEEKPTVLRCPECGSEDLIIAGRCATCTDCGWSLCSL